MGTPLEIFKRIFSPLLEHDEIISLLSFAEMTKEEAERVKGTIGDVKSSENIGKDVYVIENRCDEIIEIVDALLEANDVLNKSSQPQEEEDSALSEEYDARFDTLIKEFEATLYVLEDIDKAMLEDYIENRDRGDKSSTQTVRTGLSMFVDTVKNLVKAYTSAKDWEKDLHGKMNNLVENIREGKNTATIGGEEIHYYILNEDEDVESLRASHYFTKDLSGRPNNIFAIEHTDSTLRINHLNVFLQSDHGNTAMNIHVIPSNLKEEFQQILASQS